MNFKNKLVSIDLCLPQDKNDSDKTVHNLQLIRS